MPSRLLAEIIKALDKDQLVVTDKYNRDRSNKRGFRENRYLRELEGGAMGRGCDGKVATRNI